MLICYNSNSNTLVHGHKLKKKNHSIDDSADWVPPSFDDSRVQRSQSHGGLVITEPKIF